MYLEILTNQQVLGGDEEETETEPVEEDLDEEDELDDEDEEDAE